MKNLIILLFLMCSFSTFAGSCKDNLIPKLNKASDVAGVGKYLDSLEQTVLFSDAEVDGSYCFFKEWYENRMSSRQRSSRLLAVLIIVLGASLPLIAIMDDVFKKQKFWVGFIGAAIVIAQGFSQTFQYEESWRNYTVAKLELDSAHRLWQKQVVDASFKKDGFEKVQKATDLFSTSVSKIVTKETTGFFDSLSESANNLVKKSNGSK
ncbi:DUF4231 domain-containing protein [Thalassomonas sp. RHCl1]|uniref:DUF4231 domain-containing protein n=1 Tax=Thalassomonas sp. RHCl1 TaxID=2995320 RepID=UPI00248BF3DC|nr:DUF4231 domain-containing protein [Thalassomonas sp. RHCl1]